MNIRRYIMPMPIEVPVQLRERCSRCNGEGFEENGISFRDEYGQLIYREPCRDCFGFGYLVLMRDRKITVGEWRNLF